MESLNVNKKRILVVDDEQPIRTLIERAVKAAGLHCLTAGDGLEALEILKKEPVDIVITDVVMPRMNGIELTNKIREKFNADVIVMTGFISDYRFEDVVAEGASDFVQKPASLQEVVIRIKRVIQERENAAERNRMGQELQESFRRLKKGLEDTISVLARAIETRDPYTSGHQKRVSELSCLIGKEIHLPPEQLDGLRLAGLIHDIGKISIPSEILNKPGRLSEVEYNLIKTHSEIAYEILKHVDFPWPIADMVLQHHERLDGTGYPKGLKSDNILLEAKILAVADVVDAMAAHRPYRPSLGVDQALEEITRSRDRLYDSRIVEACLRVIDREGNRLFPVI